MRFEIDQSGKIEDTAKHSALAFSNDHDGAVILIVLLDVDLQWRLIGKRSQAHEIAYRAFRRKHPARRVAVEAIWRSVKKIAGGYLNFGLSPKNRYSGPASKKSIARRQQKSTLRFASRKTRTRSGFIRRRRRE